MHNVVCIHMDNSSTGKALFQTKRVQIKQTIQFRRTQIEFPKGDSNLIRGPTKQSFLCFKPNTHQHHYLPYRRVYANTDPFLSYFPSCLIEAVWAHTAAVHGQH